jgi:hypothetical protein
MDLHVIQEQKPAIILRCMMYWKAARFVNLLLHRFLLHWYFTIFASLCRFFLFFEVFLSTLLHLLDCLLATIFFFV